MKALKVIKKIFKNKVLQIASFSIVLFLLLIWIFVVNNYLEKIPEGFRYDANIISVDNLYDQEKNDYSGEISSNTKFFYQFLRREDDVYIINNVFDVKTSNGDTIFSVERNYGINPLSGEHVSGYGDKDRSGYLFAPKNLNKEPYLYWHVNYDTPVEMTYVAEEKILGLETYKYTSNFTVDQSESLDHLPGVGEERGISTVVSLFIWIEPTSGHMVKYEDSAIAYYYDLKSGEIISPWNKFSNRYATTSIAENVHQASNEKIRLMIFEKFIPALFILVLLGLLLSITIKNGRSKVLRKLTPVIFLAISLIATFSTWYVVKNIIKQQINTKFETESSVIESIFQSKVEVFANLLRSGRGLFNASDNVTETEWHEFTEGLKLQKNYPGIVEMGFMFEENSLGIYSKNSTYDNAVKETISNADTYQNITISDEVIFNNNGKRESGFIMYVPVYEKNNANSILGYVYGIFFTDNFVATSLSVNDFNIDFEIYDSGPEIELYEANKIYESNPSATHQHSNYAQWLQSVRNYDLYNNSWRIVYLAPTSFSLHSSEELLPNIILVSGTILSFLIFISTYLLSTSRTRALEMADTITKDLRLEKTRLASANAKDEAILRGLADGVIAVNKAGEILFINKAASDLLQLNVRDCVGKDLIKLVKMTYENGKKVPNSKRPLKFVLEGKTIASEKYYLSKKDGTRFPVAFNTAPIVIEGKIVGAIDIFRDISKESEIDKEKTEFVSLASHQLRTPLTAIKWYSEALLSSATKKLSKEENIELNQIKTSNERMVELVDTLLNVSRIEMGTLKLDLTPIKIIPIVKSILQEVSSTVKEKHIHLEENFAKNIPKIKSDAKILRMIFQNLITNSIKYTPNKGTVKINIKVSDDKKNILASVSDNGFGIPKKQQNKIFSKLFRANNAMAKVTDGTGLGLYIVKGAIEKLGGKIWFESQENKGSSFYFTLPIKKS